MNCFKKFSITFFLILLAAIIPYLVNAEIDHQFLITIENPHFDISVAIADEVIKQEDGDTEIWLIIEEGLRGTIKTGKVKVVPIRHIYEGEVVSVLNKLPQKGDKIIAITILAGADIPYTELVNFVEFSEQNKKVVLEKMAPEERIQLPLFFLIVISPLLNLALFIVLLRAKLSHLKKKLIRYAILFLPLMALGVYTIYESGISVYTDIRIDLLLIYFSLFFSFLFYPVIIINILKSKKYEHQVQ